MEFDKEDSWFFPIANVYFFFQLIFLFVIKTVPLILGFFLVPVGLPFLKEEESVSDGRKIYNLPKWLWLWGNDADGANGDKRLWWDKNCDALAFFGLFPWLRSKGINAPTLTSGHWLAQYWWLAFRNPANNLRYVPYISCQPINTVVRYFGQEKVKDKLGMEGWQLVFAIDRKYPFAWCGLYWVIKFPNSNHGLRIRLGYKVEPDDRYKDQSIGFAISISIKDLT